MRGIGFFDWWKTENRAQEQVVTTAQMDTALRSALGGSQITVSSVLNIPAVSGSVSFIAGTVASLPIRLYRTEGGRSEEVTDDYRLRLLNEETGDLLDAFQWKCTLIRDYLLPGNGYTYVDWVQNRINGLYYVDPMQVSAEIGSDPIFKTARFFIGGNSYREHEIMRVLRNTRDGVTGVGVVAESPTQLETMINALKYENRMVRTGAKKGFLKVEAGKKVTQPVLDQLRDSWRKMYGSDSEETTVVLNDGIDFKDAGQTAVDTQLNENKETNDHEIYKIFSIVPTVLEGGASAEDLKNTVRFAIQPVVKALQLAINRFCLLENEKGALTFEIDMDALDGTDMLSRYQAYEIAVRNGWMQLDEVRYDEGRNPLGLKFIRLGLDTVIYDPESKMIYTPNTKEWASVQQKGGGDPIAGRNPSG
ncbi:MAG: phage portal protein [Oscillospiraceae bacterium]|nr:phage portal protein [Oscillospiraceae bacterium]